MNSDAFRDRSLAAVRASICLFCLCVPVSIAGANISWGLLLAGLLAYVCAGGKLPFDGRRSLVEKPLWIFLAAAVAAALLGADPANSLRSINKDVHKVWLYTLFAVGLTLESTPRALCFMAAGFAFSAVVGCWQAIPSLFGEDSTHLRAHAFVHPATFGEQMCVGALGAFCFLLRPPDCWDRALVRKIAGALALLTGAALFLSHTRGAALACAAGVFMILFFVPRLRPHLGIALIAGLAFFVGMEIFNFDRSILWQLIEGMQSKGFDGPQFIRLKLWNAAFKMGCDNLWTGVGPDNYRALFASYHTARLDGHPDAWGSAHNLYLHHFAERGLLGLAALAGMLGALWIRALRRSLDRPDAWNLWAFGTITSFLVMNLTEVALQTEILWMLVFFVWIWAEVLHKRADRAAEGRGRPPPEEDSRA